MEIEELTKEQVYSVVEFAQSLYNPNAQFGIYTPDMLNSLMKDLNITPRSATYDELVKALQNAKESTKDIQGYSQWMEYCDILYARLIRYYANMLSFDLSYSCKNAKKSDYSTKAYEADKKRMFKFLNNFDYKNEFHNIVMEMMRKETVFTWLRTTTGTFSEEPIDVDEKVSKLPKYTLQKMPQEYCTLTGYFESGMLYDLNLNWFLRAGVDINGYDPVIKKKFKEVFNNSGVDDYIPTNPLNKRNGTFAYTVQTSPEDGAYVFKLDPSNFNSVPFLAPIMKNLIQDDEIQLLQKNKDIASAHGLLVGELKMLDKQATGQSKDAFAISPKVLGQFLSLIQRGMKSSIQACALPLENSDFYQYQDYNPNMYSNHVKNSISLGAGASRVLYSNDKMSQEEIRNAILTDYAMMKSVYSQFENFLEYYINKKTKKFKFSFKFDGSNYLFEREAKQQQLTNLADRGIVLAPSAWASAYGFTPMEFEHMMEEANSGGMVENLTSLISIHTAGAATAKDGGRPVKSDTESNSSESRDYDNGGE